ncbi:unnamed protein product [Acanthosepion pharaonis]|uniref:Adenylate kinase n=1 Tax=Acanthosepion pharaonis TaxID=158019 RepID=A0A812D6R3_ACAPH|nr:unnamed protein product [Sepia pharaonis]
MGCGLSDLRRSKSRRTAAVEDDTAIGSTGGHEKNKVKINYGSEARLLSTEPKVVFIFGGPGSKKGAIVNELICTFGFTLINTERIILHELMKNQSENQVPFDPSAVIRNQLKEHPDIVSLDWIMQEIIKQLDKRPKGFYLVDILPNLKVLLKLEGMMKNASEELSMLESKYPVSFVINIEKTVIKKPPSTETQNQKKNKTAGNNTQTDEADFSRTEKRLSLYTNAVKPFLDYFKKSDKLISLDCSSAPEECNSIHDLYLVNYLSLNDFANSKPGVTSLEKVFRALCSHITYLDFENRNFLVDMTDIEITTESFRHMSAKKPVLFFEVTNSILKKYLDCRSQFLFLHSPLLILPCREKSIKYFLTP